MGSESLFLGLGGWILGGRRGMVGTERGDGKIQVLASGYPVLNSVLTISHFKHSKPVA